MNIARNRIDHPARPHTATRRDSRPNNAISWARQIIHTTPRENSRQGSARSSCLSRSIV